MLDPPHQLSTNIHFTTWSLLNCSITLSEIEREKERERERERERKIASTAGASTQLPYYDPRFPEEL